jgi:type II secretory pathway predicted ATPase ExeA
MTEKSFIEKIYNLKQNPFANWVDPNVEMAGRQKEKNRWTEIVNRRKGAQTNVMCFIFGDYGFGKTLTLHKIIEQYKDEPEILPIIMKMLSEDKVSRFGVDFIKRIFRQVPREIFESFDFKEIDFLSKYFPEPAKIFMNIVLKGEGGMDFLYGQRTFSSAEMSKSLGIKQKIDSTDIAKKYLLCFLYLLGGVSKKTLLVAVDETEYVFSQMSGASIASVFNTLRDLFDLQSSLAVPDLSTFPNKPANMIFFFGISNGGWKQINDLSRRDQVVPSPVQPFLRRLEKPIELQPLNYDETKELIEKRLRTNRVSGDIDDEPLIPYDETFVEFIYKQSLGNPSEIVKFCDFALEDGLKDKIKMLDAKFAEKVFIDRGLIFDDKT